MCSWKKKGERIFGNKNLEAGSEYSLLFNYFQEGINESNSKEVKFSALSLFDSCFDDFYPFPSLSFQKWDIVNKPEFINFWNWGKVFFRTREFYKALGNSLFFTGGAVVFQTAVGLFLAVGISRINSFRPVYRFIFFLPVVMSLVAAGILWFWMYNPTLGIINVLLKNKNTIQHNLEL